MNQFYQIVRSTLKVWTGRGVNYSYSQDGEDILTSALLSKRKGIYVDVGAYHPMLYSNTYRMYRKGWKGLVIDPNMQMQPLYKVFRPRDVFVNKGVAKETATRTYYMFSDGAYNTFSKEEADLRKKDTYPKFVGTKDITCQPLAEILNENSITHIDFLTIDVEGLDVEVLTSHDWNVLPTIIAIEDNAFDVQQLQKSPAYRYLVEKGYYLAAFAPRTLIFKLR